MKQHDDSRPGTFKSGGQRIDDHKSWVGSAEKGGVFPKGAHMKQEHSADGAGSLGVYEDTTEAIKKQQGMGESQMRRHSQKHLERN